MSPPQKKRKPLQLVSQLGALSMVAAGVVGAVTMRAVGPPLAMAWQIWSGRNTEPTMPEVDYPWVLHGFILLLCLAGFRASRRSEGKAALLLFHGGALVSALVPFWALYQLGTHT